MKIKYQERTTFAKPNNHSKTMDINNVDWTTLAMTQRPKVQSHLKSSSIKFTGNHGKDEPVQNDVFKKVVPYMQQIRNSPFATGLRGLQNDYPRDRSYFSETGSTNNSQFGDGVPKGMNDLSLSRRMKLDNEYGKKNHLTSAPGWVNQNPDFKTVTQNKFTKIKDFDDEHRKDINNLKTFLSSTTYSIGRKPNQGGTTTEPRSPDGRLN